MNPSNINKVNWKTSSLRACCWCSAWLLCSYGGHDMLAMQAPDVQPQRSHVPVRAKAIHPALPEIATPSLDRVDPQGSQEHGPAPPSNKGAEPATVLLENGRLTVTADGSDLSQILETLARMSGMTINGKIKSSLVYGVYGPLDPREVLTHLLKGSGNNFLMVGVVQDGAPRELLLTPEKTASSSVAPSASLRAASSDQKNLNVDSPESEPLGPGAILHVPPAPPEDPEVRMRQNLERLKHRNEQQAQPNSPQ